MVPLALLAGCTTPDRDSTQVEAKLTYRYQPAPLVESGAPRQPITDAQVEVALAAHAERRAYEAELVASKSGAISFRGANLALPELVRRIRACYAGGNRDLAATWIDAHPSAREWDQSADLVSVEARFVRSGRRGALELTVRRRSGVEGPLAVAFPPGTYAVASPSPATTPALPEPGPLEFLTLLADRGSGWTRPESDRRWGHWPRAQDLALLQAPVVVLRADQDGTRILVPVACADFDVFAPKHGRSYGLARFEPNSPVDRLLVELCCRAPDDREAQLAVWMAHEDLAWGTFTRRDGHRGQIVTFERSRPIRSRHAKGAARLLLEAGVDPRPLQFFAPTLQPAPGEGTPGEGIPDPGVPGAEPAPAPWISPLPLTPQGEFGEGETVRLKRQRQPAG
ncbi:MAG: hypothetical protein JKY65_28650 [Planctomycetes bacterium]|nr:hypothetical protein [Planctomycetota bacterium]